MTNASPLNLFSSELRTIVCTIHQPPGQVFAGFDDVAVLASGRVAYFGEAKAMGDYFASIGKPPPDHTTLRLGTSRLTHA